MAIETVAHQIGGINNQITDDFGADNDLEVTGGGRGWTATTTIGTEVWTAKSTSKLGAAEALYAAIKAGDPRTKDERAYDADMTAREAGLYQPEDMSEAEFERCVAECVSSTKPYCACKCDGANHGTGVGRQAAAVIGPKQCKCGCGGTTKRLFVPGHDARFHARERLEKQAAANGISIDDQIAQNKADRLAAARAKRAARKVVPVDGESAKTDA